MNENAVRQSAIALKATLGEPRPVEPTVTLSEEPHEAIRQYLETLAGMGDPTAKLTLEHGETYEWRPRGEAKSEYPVGRGKAKECYGNSLHAAVLRKDEGWQYVEGYVLTDRVGFPIHHAWCLDGEGNIVELTLAEAADGKTCGFCSGNGTEEVAIEWDEEDGEETGWDEQACFWCNGSGEEEEAHGDPGGGTVYLGIPFPTKLAAELTVRRGIYGLGELLPEALERR